MDLLKWGDEMMFDKYSTIEFLHLLKKKYSDYLKPGIIEVHLRQYEDEVFLEVIELEVLDSGLEKYSTSRINTDFITEFDETMDEPLLFLDPKDDITVNVMKFVEEMDPYSIINTTDLFHDRASDLISKKYNIFGINK